MGLKNLLVNRKKRLTSFLLPLTKSENIHLDLKPQNSYWINKLYLLFAKFSFVRGRCKDGSFQQFGRDRGHSMHKEYWHHVERIQVSWANSLPSSWHKLAVFKREENLDSCIRQKNPANLEGGATFDIWIPQIREWQLISHGFLP